MPCSSYHFCEKKQGKETLTNKENRFLKDRLPLEAGPFLIAKGGFEEGYGISHSSSFLNDPVSILGLYPI